MTNDLQRRLFSFVHPIRVQLLWQKGSGDVTRVYVPIEAGEGILLSIGLELDTIGVELDTVYSNGERRELTLREQPKIRLALPLANLAGWQLDILAWVDRPLTTGLA